MKKHIKSLSYIGAFSLLALASTALAQEDESYLLYEKPVMTTLSQMYWALDKLSLQDDVAVDNFMFINECNLFLEYYHNEFEWKSIRKSTRKYIQNNKSMFPVRFEIEQPLEMADYDFDTETFEIKDEFKIDNIKLFEVQTPEYQKDVCNMSGHRELKDYPRGLVVEFAKPLTLTNIKMSPEDARQYIEFKKIVKNSGPRGSKIYYSNREAYIVMKIKVFSVKGDEKGASGSMLARVLAALESIDVYADKERRYLMYSTKFRDSTNGSSAEEILRKRVLERLKIKREEDARKAAEDAEKAKAQEAADSAS
ncbi:MAG: DUF4852 domain-containing protein [Micavibrio sp.]|nr:DUF4852 domain-containing protein [Micavibrio sp.]